MDNLLQDVDDAFSSIGEPVYSIEFCVWILAFFSVYSPVLGEQVVLNKAFCSVLLLAKRKLKIEGGEVPIHVDELVKAIAEMQSDSEISQVWKKKFLTRYRLILPKKI